MAMNNILKTGLRAGVVALALAGSAVVGTVPAQAQSSFGFSLNFGNGGPNFHGAPKGRFELHFGDRDYFKFCLTNAQIERGIRNKGYRDVKIVREDRRNNIAYLVASKGRTWYSMRIDRCTGKVDRVREVQRRRDGTFRIEFNF